MASGVIKKSNMLLHGSVSGTTSASGNLVTTIDKAGKIVVGCNCVSTGYCGAIEIGGTSLIFHVVNNTGASLANTTVTIDYYYYET